MYIYIHLRGPTCARWHIACLSSVTTYPSAARIRIQIFGDVSALSCKHNGRETEHPEGGRRDAVTRRQRRTKALIAIYVCLTSARTQFNIDECARWSHSVTCHAWMTAYTRTTMTLIITTAVTALHFVCQYWLDAVDSAIYVMRLLYSTYKYINCYWKYQWQNTKVL